MKFIHTADLHLDSKMEGMPTEKSKIRREEVLEAFERLCEYASKNQVTAVIIAGDMFDTAKVTIRTRDRVLHAIKADKKVDYLYLSGNHDDDNFLSKIEELPENLKVFTDQWTSFTYDNVVISGATLNGLNNTAIFETQNHNEEKVNIVVLHGQVAGYNSKETAEVIPLPKFKDKNIDYLALGHIHTAVMEKLDNRGVYAYCGCLEGRGFDETGDKGFILLDIEDKKVSPRFIKFSTRNLYEHEFNIEGYPDYLTARDQLLEDLKCYSLNSLIKVVLKGEHTTDFIIDKEQLTRKLNDEFFFAKIKDKTILKVNVDDYSLDKSVRGEFVRAVWESDLSEEEKSKVIIKGLQALKGERI